MSRFLHRPMFRRGGSTGEGITSGLAPRQRYEEAGAVGGDLKSVDFKTQSNGSTDSTFPAFPEIKLPKSTAGADFWLNLGTSILAQPGGRPILQTLGTAGREPLARYQQQRSQEDLLKYKHAQGERQFQLEWYKALNSKDKIALREKIDYLVEEHGLSKEEALARAMREHRLPMSEEDITRQAEEYERDQRDKRIDRVKETEGINIDAQAGRIIDFEDSLDEWTKKGFDYESDQLYIEPTDFNKLKPNPEKPGELTPDGRTDHYYILNRIYVDSKTGNVYLWNGITFTIQDINAEIIPG